MAFTRSFTDTSWWNRPIPSTVPADPFSAKYIQNLKNTEPKDRIGIGTGAWAMFYADSAHVGTPSTITNKAGKKVQVHTPAKVDLMSGNDKACVFRCLGCDLEVSLFEAVQVNATTWRCTNFGAYHPSTEGISGSQGNSGHRGIPPSAMMITGQELLEGAINHRLKMGVKSPADRRLDGKAMPIWPMDGYEKGHGTAIPEGAVLRLKASAFARVNPKGTSRTIATAAMVYGIIVGETGGHATIKGQLNATLPPDTSKALDLFHFADYEVMTLGWGK